MSVNEISDAKIIIAFCISYKHLLYINCNKKQMHLWQKKKSK